MRGKPLRRDVDEHLAMTFASESAVAATGHSRYTPAQMLVDVGLKSGALDRVTPFTASLMLFLSSSVVMNFATYSTSSKPPYHLGHAGRVTHLQARA